MTKRERMWRAIRHQEADRVPKGEISISGGFANRLLDADYPLDYQHFARDWAVRQRLNADFVNIGDWPSEQIGADSAGRVLFRSVYGYEYASTGASVHITKPPVADIEDARRYQKPDIGKVSPNLLKRFVEETDLFVFGQIGGPVTQLDEMFGMEDYMVYCMTNTAEMGYIGERVMEFEVEKAKLFLDSGAHAILMGDDIAFNSGLLLPPRIMEEIVYPLHKAAVREIKRYKDVPVFLHSDGDIRAALPAIVDSGFDGLHSLQPSAGVDIGAVKRDYGGQLCLIGNIDLDYIMTFASVSEVEENVKRTIDVAAPGGGYILSTCNTLIDAVPPENALAMYRTGESYGSYR